MTGPDDAVVLAGAGGHHALFAVFVGLHVASAVIGFAAVGFAGLYGGAAGRPDKPGALAEARRFFARPNQATLATLAVPFFGAAALVAGGRSSDFGHAWVVAALALWLGVAGVLTGVVRPSEARLAELLASEHPDPTALRPLARRLSWGAGACDVAFVLALGLMIWQP